jgi:hypothetical protein
MNRCSWRSRFVARLVADVSKTAAERTRAHPRLFPYSIVDTMAKPVQVHRRLRLVVPELPKDKSEPQRQQSVWHFVKR